MSVKIRLRRTGRKKQPSYRLVVADTDTPREGRYLDSVGTYNPLTRPSDLRIDLQKVDEWLARGAGMSDTVASLVRKARKGGDKSLAVRPVGADEKPAVEVVGAVATPAAKPKAGSRGAPRVEAADQPAAPAGAGQPSAGAQAEPAAEAPSEPAADAPSEPAADAASQPAAEAPSEPAAEAATEPAPDTKE
jgi:small subunit ribosomal protein S16